MSLCISADNQNSNYIISEKEIELKFDSMSI